MNDTLRDVGASQVKLAELQRQISSGDKSQNFVGLDGSVEQFTRVNSQIERAVQYRANNQVNLSKLQTVDIALRNISEIADSMKNNMVGANGATIKTMNLPQIISDMLANIGSELNASFNGNYLFGGTDTLNPPVPSTTVANNALGVPDDVYYTGAKQDAVLRADDRTDIEFPARADDPAIQKIYAAAKMAINAANLGDTDQMSKAQQLIQTGIAELSALRTRVGGVIVNVEGIDDRLGALSTHWRELSDEISKTDLVAASTEVASYQSVLQASFQVYARLSQLRLSDYLK
jgi:flagellar hook-associated protein 3 FlgL